ncbi:hypothetical protein BJ875DRAFT_480201 [Amylocarpus encephaloides]|uniref:PWWP domain-containing protein n=1 Tax=Amylocarpus encephaloides TaxID=45428 RepID=A0A9P7YT00_9HELO|nr:hypothetical protein BJ875DRAFT_480201 [Amylocarpus encephaloides]
MAEEATTRASPPPEVSEPASVHTKSEESQIGTSDANGTKGSGATTEPSKEVAPEDAAPEEASKDEITNGEQNTTGKGVTEVKSDVKEEDIEEKDNSKAEDVAPVAGDSAEPTVATPASMSKGKGRRKSGGVPEHKTKKLKKQPSQAKIHHIDAQPGDHFFIRFKGYPLWPGIVADESMLPPALIKSRPNTAARADGTWKEGFEDGGPKTFDRQFPVMYLHTNEFSWVPNADLVEIKPDDLDTAPKGKSRQHLIHAYRLALEDHDLQYYKDLIRNHFEVKAEEQAAKEAAKAERAEKSAKPKKPRVSNAKVVEDDVDEDVEMADVATEQESEEPEAPVNSKPKTKKRKIPDEESETPQRTESVKKARPTIKLNTPKTTNGTATPKSKKDQSAAKSSKPKVKKGSKKNEIEETPEAAPKKPELSAEEKRSMKQKNILFLRHKLQKGLLTRDQEPKEDEMNQMSMFMATLEEQNDLEVSIIRATKINKVLKAILKLSSIPKEEEFHFKPRSQTLLDKWNKLLASDVGTIAAATNGVGSDEKPTTEEANALPSEPTNGVKKSPKPKIEEKGSADGSPAANSKEEIVDTKLEPLAAEKSAMDALPESAKAESTA